jgi:hypothetical protein
MLPSSALFTVDSLPLKKLAPSLTKKLAPKVVKLNGVKTAAPNKLAVAK